MKYIYKFQILLIKAALFNMSIKCNKFPIIHNRIFFFFHLRLVLHLYIYIPSGFSIVKSWLMSPILEDDAISVHDEASENL